LFNLGTLAPRSVSDGWIDWNKPASSPVLAFTLAVEKTTEPFKEPVFLLFSFDNSSSSPLAGNPTAVS